MGAAGHIIAAIALALLAASIFQDNPFRGGVDASKAFVTYEDA